MTCEDYAEDAHLIVNDLKQGRHDYHGKAGCSEMFTTLFKRLTGSNGEFTSGFDWLDGGKPKVDGNTVFLAWKSTSPSYVFEWATDTFVMGADGKFTHHNIFALGARSTTQPTTLAFKREVEPPASVYFLGNSYTKRAELGKYFKRLAEERVDKDVLDLHV